MKVVEGLYDGKWVKPLHKVEAKPNTRVMITFLDEEARPRRVTSSLNDVAGCLRYTGSAKSLDEMEDAIARGVKKEWL
jgi:hypothetical protein